MLELAIRRKVYWDHKGWVWSATIFRHLNNTPILLRVPKQEKNMFPKPLHLHQQPEALIQNRMDHCFHARLIRTGNDFQSNPVQFWWALANSSLSLPSLADKCGLRLLLPIYFKVQCAFRDDLRHSCYKWLFECHFLAAKTGLAILLWPLASTRQFHPENCSSLDIFSTSDRSLWCTLEMHKNPTRSAVSEIPRPGHLAPTTMPCSESLEFLPHSYTWFELHYILLTVSAYLNILSWCHVID